MTERLWHHTEFLSYTLQHKLFGPAATQGALAGDLGVSAPTISRIVNGKKASPATNEKIAKAGWNAICASLQRRGLRRDEISTIDGAQTIESLKAAIAEVARSDAWPSPDLTVLIADPSDDPETAADLHPQEIEALD
jgi:transcriptional regulator with XRE-family HTH domain